MKEKLFAATVASLLGTVAQAQTVFGCDGNVPCSYLNAFNNTYNGLSAPPDGVVPYGINNLIVNGEVYNVTFNAMNSPFTSLASATAAANAINNFVESFSVNPKPWFYFETKSGTPVSVIAETFWGGQGYVSVSGPAGYFCGPNDGILCTTWTQVATSSTLLNGAFVPAKPGCQLGTGSILNWTVSNNVDLVEANCNVGIAAPNGSQYYIDLTGSNAEKGVNDVGAISQVISTIVGKTYTLSFYFGGNALWKLNNPGPNDGEYKAMEISINNNVQGVFGVHTASVPYYNAQWQKETVTFTATTPFTSVAFQSLNGLVNPSDYGPLLADVTLTHN